MPPNGGRLDRASPDLTPLTNIRLSPIETLNLSLGQAYNAKVLGRYSPADTAPNNTPNTETKPSVTTQAPESGSNPASRNPPAQWVLLIQNKAVLIETLALLNAGQLLNVRLQSAGPNNDLSLVLNGTRAPGQLHGSVGSNAAYPTTTSVAANVEHLIRSMSQSLPRQISLASGIEALQYIADSAKPPSTAGPANQMAGPSASNVGTLPPLPVASQDVANFAASLLGKLQQAFPRADQLLAPGYPDRPAPPASSSNPASTSNSRGESPTGSGDTIHAALKSAMQSSGMMLENTLVNSRQQLDLFQSNLLLQKAGATLSEVISRMASAPENARPGQKQTSEAVNRLVPVLDDLARVTARSSADESTAKMANALLSQTRGLINSPYTERMQALAEMQKQIQRMSSQTQTVALDASAGKDLKASLITLVAALAPAPKPGSAAIVDGLVQQDLLRSPFQFPHPGGIIEHSTAFAKVEAVLAGQELSTGQVLKLLAGMLNRLQFNQLNSLYQGQSGNSEGNQNQSLFFELPINNTNSTTSVLQLRIDSEDKTQQQQEQKKKQTRREWKLRLSFDLEGLGKLHIHANLSPPNISTHIWSEQQDTLALIRSEQNKFRERLSQLGLEVNDIHCYPGRPKTEQTPIQQGLVDTRA